MPAALVLVAIGAWLGSGRERPRARHDAASAPERVLTRAHQVKLIAPPPPPPPAPPLVVRVQAGAATRWATVALVRGHPAAWLARRSGVTLLRFDQRLLRLDLHAGSSDGGSAGWRFGNRVTSAEIHRLVAGFNGGFKLSYPNVGFASGGHVAVELKSGLASIVTYADGVTDIGAWGAGVPAPGRPVFSVLQNQRLLVDHGAPAASVGGCIIACWGNTVGNLTSVARSGLGITPGGELIWAAGEHLLPADLAGALVRAGAIRAIELDINPDWVAGYLYAHRPSGPAAMPLVPGQLGIAGALLEPYSRDFLTIVTR